MQSGERMGVALAETINTAAGTMFTFKSATLTAVSFYVDFIILKTSWGGWGAGSGAGILMVQGPRAHTQESLGMDSNPAASERGAATGETTSLSMLLF